MQKKKTVERIIKLIIVCAVFMPMMCRFAEASAEHDDFIPLWGPYLTDVDETEITVNWKTVNESVGAVWYATDEYYQQYVSYSHNITDSEKQLHQVQLNDLIPDTKYHYQLEIQGECTADSTFTTLGNGVFSFVIYGDTQEQIPLFTQLERHKLVANYIAAEEDISFVLHAGDLVNDVTDPGEWGHFFEAARQMLARVPIYPVLGNHEDNNSCYYENFGVPQWYSINCSNAHFTMLDSNLSIALQKEWLMEDLDCNPTWKFVVYHHPPYSSSSKNWGGWLHTRTEWEPLFIENGIDAVFSGHVHAYERYCENGIHYTVLGTGGGPCYELAEDKISGYRNSLEYTLGYARVTVDGNEAYMDMIKVADVSQDNSEITNIYPPGTVFERVNLSPEIARAHDSLTASTNIVLQSVGISVEPSMIDYGDICNDDSSGVEMVHITNTGNVAAGITLEIEGFDDIAQSFFEQSLYLDGSLYDIAAIIATIEKGQVGSIATQLHAPKGWSEAGLQEARFVFWGKGL